MNNDLKNEYNYIYELYGDLEFIGTKYNVNKGDLNLIYYENFNEKTLISSIDKDKDNKYYIKFELKEDINTNLEGANADISKLISSNLRNLDSKNIKLYLSETITDQLYIKQEIISEPIPTTYIEHISFKLASGAIMAGIIIGLIVVLIAIAIGFILFNKHSNPPQTYTNAISELNSSSTRINNI